MSDRLVISFSAVACSGLMYRGVPSVSPDLGHPPAVGRRADGERDPEIGDERTPAAQQDVLRLDVPMDDAVLVGVAQRIRHFARDANGFVDRQLTLARQPVAQRSRPTTYGMT